MSSLALFKRAPLVIKAQWIHAPFGTEIYIRSLSIEHVDILKHYGDGDIRGDSVALHRGSQSFTEGHRASQAATDGRRTSQRVAGTGACQKSI